MRLFIRILLSVLLLSAHLSAQNSSLSPEEFMRAANQMDWRLPDAPPARALADPTLAKLDPALRDLLAQSGNARAERSIQLGATAVDPRVPVVARTFTLAARQALETTIRSRQGEIAGTFENVIWATVPIDALSALAADASVHSIDVQPVYQTDRPQAPSDRATPNLVDGIRAAQIQLMHERGFTGKGVKIGILDAGFGGYSKLQRAGKVKPARAQRAFPQGYSVENSEVHGTACAEIISAIAPDAEIYLAAFNRSEGGMLAASNWLMSQGVQIISYSMGNTTRSTDGTDEASRIIDDATLNKGILWVVSAGNTADAHWGGPSSVNAEGNIDIGGNKGIRLKPLDEELRIVVRWNDWGADARTPAATQDIDIELYEVDAEKKTRTFVAKSAETQNGGTAKPLEVIAIESKTLAQREFFLVLKARRVTRRFDIHVFVNDSTVLYPMVAAGSILNPASARTALAVGAVDVTKNELAPYSSQGPTDDNRLKPDVAAPTNTLSSAYEGRFPGTSASCPHVAAFAALLLQSKPGTPASELRLMVMRTVSPRGTPVPNNLFGFGHIDGGRTIVGRPPEAAPRLTDSIPIPGEFGGSIRMRTLENVTQNNSSGLKDGLNLKLVSGRDLYTIGDRMRLGFKGSEDSQCLLFNRDSRGSWSLVAPTEGRRIRLLAGEIAVFPENEEDTLEVVEPSGTEHVVLVCARQPVPLEQALSSTRNPAVAVAVYRYEVLPRE